MIKGLSGKHVAIGASRKTEEISMLIEKQGGIPLVRSLQGTTYLAEKEVEPELNQLINEGTDWIIFTTGMGIETLLDIAEKLGVLEQFKTIVQQANIASRGYKTLAALKKLGINPAAVDEDGTTKGLIHSLASFDFAEKTVTIQLHGDRAPALIKYFEDRGANVSLILPYKHIPPKTETVETLCREMLEHEVDAICFTSAVQVRSLFDYCRENNSVNSLIHSFQTAAVAVAVGKVTAEALREEGVERVITPENERMGAMVLELSRYYGS